MEKRCHDCPEWAKIAANHFQLDCWTNRRTMNDTAPPLRLCRSAMQFVREGTGDCQLCHRALASSEQVIAVLTAGL